MPTLPGLARNETICNREKRLFMLSNLCLLYCISILHGTKYGPAFGAVVYRQATSNALRWVAYEGLSMG